MKQLFKRLKNYVCSLWLPKVTVESGTEIERLQRRIQLSNPSTIAKYTVRKGIAVLIDVWHPTVEATLISLHDAIIAMEAQTPLMEDTTTIITRQLTINVDDWLLSNDGYPISLMNLRSAALDLLDRYTKAMAEVANNSHVKMSYYMRVTDEINRDLSVIADLLTHDWR